MRGNAEFLMAERTPDAAGVPANRRRDGSARPASL